MSAARKVRMEGDALQVEPWGRADGRAGGDFVVDLPVVLNLQICALAELRRAHELLGFFHENGCGSSLLMFIFISISLRPSNCVNNSPVNGTLLYTAHFSFCL